MSLRNNLPYSVSGCKNEVQENLCCPHCGFKTCWGHGGYPRKGFHRQVGEMTNQIVWVPRCICCSPACGRSFCILPVDVMPYQRFFWPDFLFIAELAEAGKNPYRIAATLAMVGEHCRTMAVGLAVIVRTLQRIREFRAWAARVAQELDATVSLSLKETVSCVVRVLDWFRFTRRWFHALYPARFCLEGNPHKSTLSP